MSARWVRAPHREHAAEDAVRSRTWWRRRLRSADRRRERGQAVVEFALILPLMILLVLIAIDFGRLFYTYVGMTNAAREGAAYGSQHASCLVPSDGVVCADPANITYVTRQEAGGDPTLAVSKACSPSCASSSSGAGNTVTVTTAKSYAFLTPFVNSFFGGSLQLAVSATGVIQ